MFINWSRASTCLLLLFLSLKSVVTLGARDEVAASPSIDAVPSPLRPRSRTKEHALATIDGVNTPVNNAFTQSDCTDSFVSVCVVSAFNIIFNTLRPDSSIPFQMRLPRIMWEITLFTIANMTRKHNVSPSTYILLALTTASTAAVDIFLWAPLFGVFTKFETCTGGLWWTGRPYQCQTDYVKGIGRLMVSAQSLCTGIVYLVSAINAWGAFTAMRDEQKIKQHIRAMEIVERGREHAHR